MAHKEFKDIDILSSVSPHSDKEVFDDTYSQIEQFVTDEHNEFVMTYEHGIRSPEDLRMFFKVATETLRAIETLVATERISKEIAEEDMVDIYGSVVGAVLNIHHGDEEDLGDVANPIILDSEISETNITTQREKFFELVHTVMHNGFGEIYAHTLLDDTDDHRKNLLIAKGWEPNENPMGILALSGGTFTLQPQNDYDTVIYTPHLGDPLHGTTITFNLHITDIDTVPSFEDAHVTWTASKNEEVGDEIIQEAYEGIVQKFWVSFSQSDFENETAYIPYVREEKKKGGEYFTYNRVYYAHMLENTK